VQGQAVHVALRRVLSPFTVMALARKSLTRVGSSRVFSTLQEAVAGQEPAVEQAQLGPGDEHDVGSPAADPHGAVGICSGPS
jgi:hypothetical protein